MEYDVENRLTKVISASGTTEYKYDADGKRIKKLSSSETAIYISGSYEIRITDGQQKLIKHIFTGSDRSITVEKVQGQTHTYYCHNDHLGSTNIITDENGFVVQECEYTPYGELASNTGTYNSPYKFTSKELDDFSGLYYYGARYYDAVLCHFVQADTIVPEPLNPQSFNRYSYCDNNPINYTDPTGHSWFSKIINKVEKAIEKVIQWLEKVTGAEWDVDISTGGSIPFGPGGGGGGSPSSSPSYGSPPSYNDYGYEYDPFFDPIVYPQRVPTPQAQAPIPVRSPFGVTAEELDSFFGVTSAAPEPLVTPSSFEILSSKKIKQSIVEKISASPSPLKILDQTFREPIGRIALTALGDLSKTVFPIARATAKVGGGLLTGTTLGVDLATLVHHVQTRAPTYEIVHDAMLVASDAVSYVGILYPPLKPLRWVSLLIHTWDTATQNFCDRRYGNK